MARIRFRNDHRYIAERKALGDPFREESGWYTREEWDAVEPARAGDTWRVRWHAPEGQEGPIAGYDICCVKCGHVHSWTTATNCASKRQLPDWEYTDFDTGEKRMVKGGSTCDHSGKGSCWTWTGSAEEGTLTAQPSLYCQEALGGCGFHGFLTNGEIQ
jgi:hypothetical protein